MKLLHVGPAQVMHASGLPKSIFGLASAQAAFGLKAGLLSSSPLTQDLPTKEIPGVCWLGGPRKSHYNPWLISADWICYIREKFGAPDLVNFHSTYIPFHTALARRCRQVRWPYVITAHGMMDRLAQNVKRAKKGIANLLFFRAYVEHAEAVHAFTSSEAEEIRQQFKVRKIITVPNGVDDYLLEASKKLSAADLADFGSEGHLMLGFVGRIDMYHKGLDLLLNALKILQSQPQGPRCRLFVIGPFHTEKDERSFHSMVELLGLKDDVRLLGAKYGDAKLRHFLACDVFVLTSRFEGMPISVLEAMAMGRPCLVTPGTNVSDVVCEGGGWNSQPDPKSIAEAIESIYEKRDSLKARGQQSHDLIRARFTWENVAQQLYKEHARLCSLG